MGKAKANATHHAFNQITNKSLTMPILKIVINSDIMPDMNKLMNNAKTIGRYFSSIILRPYSPV